MEVTMNKTSDVSARLTVKVVEDDYKAKVQKDLKEFGRTRVIPGFRKGHVPYGELYRRFGKQMTSDVINQVVYEAVMNYLRDNKVDVLGEPIPVEVKELDLKNEKDFTFEYDLALSPALDIKLDKSVKMPYYTIEVTDEMVDEQDKAFRKRFGAQVPGEQMEEDALVKGSIFELNEDGTVNEGEDAIQVVNGIILPMRFADKAEAEKFNGAKVGDKVVFNPAKASGDNLTELASMLNIDKDKAENVKGDFQFSISEFIVVKEAELGEELYTNVFGKDQVKDEKEYREAIKNMIAQQLVGNSEQLFERDFTEAMMKQYGDMQLPVELLKKWLMRRNDELTDENIDEEFKKMEPGLKWQLVHEQLARLANVKIEEDDLLNYAKFMARQQFAQYGMTNVDDETLTDYAKRILGDRNYRGNIVERVGDLKLFDAIKEMIDLDKQEVSLDRFKELAQAAPAEA